MKEVCHECTNGGCCHECTNLGCCHECTNKDNNHSYILGKKYQIMLNGYKISDIKAHKAIDLLKERWWNAIINACDEAYNKVLKDLEMLIRMTAKKRPKGKIEYHNDFFICIEKQT